ncbi:MAG: Rrf2 family transcriptional regulator [Candidatus Kapabacteria bacterium]|nr:Rrf2 family transcriptional regulator [Ignavibacteriota bacterium]MCW5884284.1 Rrf2 family transcriptional regulator [Candidatus Kapabacteria bacterium]
MTVIFSKRCEIALQAVLFLSSAEAGKMFNAGEIAKEVDVPKEFVSKILQTLTSSEIVGSKKGNSGGFYLGKPAEHIKLIDIVAAIDGLEIFHRCVLGFKGCGLSAPCPLHDEWGKLRDDTYNMLSSSTLAELRDRTLFKLQNLYKE